MKNTTLCCALAVVLSVGATAVRADEAADRKAIEGQLEKIRMAFVHKDTDALKPLLTKDFTASSPGQPTMSLKQVLEANKAAWTDVVGTPDIGMEITKVRIKGSTAIADGPAMFNLVVKDSAGTIGPKGKIHEVKIIQTIRSTWVRSATGWLAKKEEITSSQEWNDGKPSHPKAAPSKGQ